MMSAAFFPLSNIVAKTFLPLAAVISPRSTIASSSASAAGRDRAIRDLFSRIFQTPS